MTFAQTEPRTSQSEFDAQQYTIFGDRDAVPMYDYDDCIFYGLTSNDRGYFNMMLGEQLWNLVLGVQRWIVANPEDRQTLEFAARKDMMKAWALTGLAQKRRVARCCCFLQMALLHEQNVECVALLALQPVIA